MIFYIMCIKYIYYTNSYLIKVTIQYCINANYLDTWLSDTYAVSSSLSRYITNNIYIHIVAICNADATTGLQK